MFVAIPTVLSIRLFCLGQIHRSLQRTPCLLLRCRCYRLTAVSLYTKMIPRVQIMIPKCTHSTKFFYKAILCPRRRIACSKTRPYTDLGVVPYIEFWQGCVGA